MCGLAGFVGDGDRETLAAMTRALVHRGPDAEGLWWEPDQRIFLGHRRLSIIDLAGGGQPMWSPDGVVGLIFNGEIYNHQELRAELIGLGHHFQTSHSDTEVLLQGYLAWGEKLPEKLNGMWAFALLDQRRRRLFLSRDRFGKKPLYYHAGRGLFAFASELTSLLAHPGVPSALSETGLHKYFAHGFIPAPHTILKGVAKLPAGCNLIHELADARTTVSTWWRFVPEPFDTLPADPVGVWGEELRELLARAVQRRLMADVPLGVLLSGGIDSSAIATLATRALAGQPLDSFSIGFPEASFDESRHAERMAAHIGSVHHTTTFSVEMAREFIPTVLGRLDEPMGDDSLLPTFLVCREARKRVTVVLSGDGADELFAGYDPFRALRWGQLYQRCIPQRLHRAVTALAGMLPASHRYMSLTFKLQRALRGMGHPPALWNPLWLAPLSRDEMAEVFHHPPPLEEVYSEAIDAWESCPVDNPVDRTTCFYVRLYLQDGILTKVDRASMMNALEVRSPFLDRDVVAFVRRIPAAFRLRGDTTKYLLRRAMEPLLPPATLDRKKQGFALPIGQWFWQDRIPFPERNRPAQESRLLEQMRHEHRTGREDHHLFLWNQLTLDHFLLRLAGRGATTRP